MERYVITSEDMADPLYLEYLDALCREAEQTFPDPKPCTCTHESSWLGCLSPLCEYA